MQQSDLPGQIPSVPDSERNRPQSTSRRRISDRATPAEQPGASNALSTARILNSPQRASSSREMTPPESLEAVKYTRTGRVSKATKGQRVHHCDECGKTYTRAEHLRRHQQNHKPGAFPCDVPGCGRSFYREDLLTRHKARHDDPLLPPSRQGSPGSQGSAPTARSNSGLPPRPAVTQELSIDDGDIESVTVPPVSARAVGQQGGTSRTKDRYLNINELRQRAGQGPIPIDTGTWPDYSFGGYQQWDPSPPYSPTGYDSPTNNGVYSVGLPYFQPQVNSARQSSSASFSGPYPPPHTSRSPVSAGSSTVHLPHWARNARDTPYQHLSTSGPESSFGNNYGLYNSHIPGQQLFIANYGTGVWTPEDRDFMEQDELIVHLSASRSSSLDLNFDDTAFSNEERYLHAYWAWVHPFFAVIHRPSFNIHNASPLLKAAMLALGAQAQDAAADKRHGRLIHERCVKVLQKRTLNEWHSFRTSDMQAVVLVEIYSIFKSRRPPLHFSNIFERVYKHLANDPEAIDTSVANDAAAQGLTTDASGYMGSLSSAPTFDAPCKQRLLMACYMLDVQHATLFGRQRTPCFAGNGLDLPFPETLGSWDALSTQPLAVGIPNTKVWDAVDGANIDVSNSPSGYDIFQSMLMMNALCDTNTDPDCPPLPEEPGQQQACSSMFATMEQSPRAKLAYHTIKLCKLTPVRDLLAVAGESWVMAEKLSTATQFAEAQRRSKQWAEASSQPQDDNATTAAAATTAEPVHKAFRHALKILELHQLSPKTGLLFQEWSIHLASIVIWARAYSIGTNDAQRKRPRLSVPQPAEPRTSMQELERALTRVLSTATTESIDTAQARSVLLWTKAKIEKVDVPHTCGLTNGALDVLGKLVRRGDEDGWFGP